ncbi:PREDICTED: transcription termination factor MTEF1, chloroplastic-like [Ipomoea nil]|uniref:transcription termination factor MTEF1, chloroplastic-like n=1 Tax=Ipomoea nil TaxID=35883 RepID=UPI0009009F47|nr:PREDICTED: transcription termination factor MTEF1, chloroplastic-like [Ipomoea nil]
MPQTLSLSSATASPAALLKPKLPSPPPKHLHLPPAPPPPPPAVDLPDVSLPAKPEPFSPHQNSQLLQEKLLYLDSLGVDSFRCFASHPPLVSASLPQLKSVIDFLHALDLGIHGVRRVLHMCPEILTTPLSSTLLPAVTFLLREAGVDARSLPGVIRRRPRLLTRPVEEHLRPTLRFLQTTIGIEDVPRWATLLSCSVDSKFIPRLDYFQKLGFSRQEATAILRRFPPLFRYSIEENLEPKFNYFLVEMGRELKELMDYPQYFSFSLENRIKPRHQTCVEKGVCLSLPLMLKSSEVRFRDRLEVCCSSSMPVRTSPLWRAKFDDNVTL